VAATVDGAAHPSQRPARRPDECQVAGDDVRKDWSRSIDTCSELGAALVGDSGGFALSTDRTSRKIFFTHECCPRAAKRRAVATLVSNGF
jgi:hypothetical protein